MQAIRTKYLCPTNYRGARIKAECERGSVTISYPDQLGQGDEAHTEAANALVAKFCAEDAQGKHATPEAKNPWNKARVCGQLPDGSYAHVFVGGGK